MTDILSALAPVFLLIGLGFALKGLKMVPDTFWAPAEKLTFYLFFPALLVANIAGAGTIGAEALPMAAALIIGIVLVAGTVSALRPRLGLDGPGFTSVFQGSFRPNTYVGIGAAYALFGEAGLALMAIAVVAVVPLVNVLAVFTLVRHGAAAGQAFRWRQAIGPAATNPIILACLLGLGLNLGEVGLPRLLAPLLDILGSAALPVGLMAVGAGLDLGAARKHGRTVAMTTAIKLGVLPLATVVLCVAFGVAGQAATISVMYASLPGSATSYVMARQMGGNATLMAGIITATTIAAMAALPAWVRLVG
jgi:malonate transporter